MSVPEVNHRPKLRRAYAVLGRSVSWAVESSGAAWPEATSISVLGSPGDPLITIPASRFESTGMVAVWDLTPAVVDTLEGRNRWRVETDDGIPPMVVSLIWLSGWTGSVDEEQLVGTVVLGPKGLTGKSAYDAAVDAGYTGTEEEWAAGLASQRMDAIAAADRAEAAENIARGLVTSSVRAFFDPDDPGLISLSIPVGMIDPDDPCILHLPVVDDFYDESLPFVQLGADAASLTSGTALDGWLLTADGRGGAAWEPFPGDGVLNDLTDVATDGATTGDALTYTGSGWAPSAHPAVLDDDTRLSDHRTPTAHTHTVADLTDAGDVAGLDIGTTAGTVAAGDDTRILNATPRRDPWADAYADGMFYYAHRNSDATGPDGSLTAARIAIAAGADSLDADIRLIGDGTPVLMHDTTVDRTTDGTGDALSFTMISWQSLRIDAAGLGFSGYPSEAPPTLAEFLAEFGGRVRIHLQLYVPAGGTTADHDAIVAAVDELVTRLGIDKRMLTLSSNSSYPVPILHALGYRTMLVTTTWTTYAAKAIINGCDEIHLGEAACTPETVATIHGLGAAVSAWAPNTHRARDLVIAAGVDAVMTDNPGYVSGRFILRQSDIFTTQAYTAAHIKQAGTSGAFISPDAYGWATPTSTDDYQTIGYLAPVDGANATLAFELWHDSGDAHVWLGKSDDWDAAAEAAGRTGCTGWLLTITAAGNVRLEERVDAVRTQWLAYDVAVAGYTVGDSAWHSWQLFVTPETVGWRYVATGQSGAYETTAALPVRFVEIGQSSGATRYRSLRFN